MAILDLIHFMDDSGTIMVCKRPQDDQDEIRLGSQLVVQESQIAYFYRDGKFLDTFGPGRHTLQTNNIPLLGALIGAPFGGRSPFKAYVYFVATKVFTNLGWGTTSPVLFRDTDFRMVSLRAHGIYSMRISNPVLFLNTLVGTKGFEYTAQLEDFLRSMIVSQLNGVLGRQMKSILDLPMVYNEISETTKNNVRAEFEQYGLELVDLIVEAITPPEEVQKMLNRATGVAAQDAEKYRAIAAADAVLEAAKNPSGGAGSATGAGLGLGIGISMAQTLTEGIRPASQVAASSAPPGGDTKSKLIALKELLDSGLITQEEFEQKKQKLLDAI